MKINSALALLPLALAAPAQLQKRLPNHTPVDVEGLDSDFTVNCGKTKVAGEDVHKAVSWGVNLEVAGETLGANKYPHYYGNDGNTRFEFLNPDCNKQPQNNRKEFPIVKGGYFEGENDTAYKFRAIYLFNKADPYTQNPQAIYCGTIYHVKDNFEGCDIKKKST